MQVSFVVRQLGRLAVSTFVIGLPFGACTFPDVAINPDAQCAVDSSCIEQGLGYFCDERALCVTCRSDGDCLTLELGKRCSAGSCLMCGEDADCDSGHCNEQTGACIECEATTDCGEQHCVDSTCVECEEDAHCAPGACRDNRCVQCTQDMHCQDAVCHEDTCVPCTPENESHCPPDWGCQQNVCVAEHCDSGVKDGDETGSDCGGSCLPCGDGEGCDDGGDCASGFCDGTTCAPCGTTADCTEPAFCDGGTCAPPSPIGETCPNVEGACVEGAFCVGGICCESACDGVCRGCSEFVTGEPDGQCANALPGTSCTTLGIPIGTCNSGGSCAPLGLGG